jgi:hypothetical protein
MPRGTVGRSVGRFPRRIGPPKTFLKTSIWHLSRTVGQSCRSTSGRQSKLWSRVCHVDELR